MNLCNCKYAKPENGGGDSVTWWYVCKITGQTTDPENCAKCARKEDTP